MEQFKKDTAQKKRFSSFFGKFSGRKNPDRIGKLSGSTHEKMEDTASKMILKLTSPEPAGHDEEGSNGLFLTDVLTNEQLFDIWHGKSLVLQAEMTVEKQAVDGTPKMMTIRGLVPATLSKGQRNGKPTRELRVRGHLRRKRSREVRVPYDDLNSRAVGGGKMRKEIPLERRPKKEDVKLLGANSKVFERYRTLSTVSANKSKKNSGWPQADTEGVRSQFLNNALEGRALVDSDDDDPEPSRIENWSPLFDFSSPMSGPTERDRVRALSDWTTPTPRFDLDLVKGEGYEGSKEKMQEADKRKSNQQVEETKNDLKIIGRTLVIGPTDSFPTTQETGSQTADLHNGKDESKPGVISKTLPKKGNYIAPEEIKEKISKGFNESKEMISSLKEKASNTFSEVHGKIKNAITKTDERRDRQNEPRHKQIIPGDIVNSVENPHHPTTYWNGAGHPNSTADTSKSLGHRSSGRHGSGFDGHDNIERHEESHPFDHSVRGGSEKSCCLGLPCSKGHDNGSQFPDYPNTGGHGGSQFSGHASSRGHDGSRLAGSQNSKGRDRCQVGQGTDNTTLGSNKVEISCRESIKNTRCPTECVPIDDATRSKKLEDVQNLHYSTKRGYYYTSPHEDPTNQDHPKSPESGRHAQDEIGKIPDRTRFGTAYHQAVEKAKERIRGNILNKDSLKSSGKNLPDNRHINPHDSKLEIFGSKIPSGEKKKSPTGRELQDSKKSSEKIGKVEEQKMNPITTITVSRSHTRLYNYSDGYTYTEKPGRQMVIIEAPRGMYYAT